MQGFDLGACLLIDFFLERFFRAHCKGFADSVRYVQATNMPRTILCAVDGTPKSLGVLEWASAFSREMGATLKLIPG